MTGYRHKFYDPISHKMDRSFLKIFSFATLKICIVIYRKKSIFTLMKEQIKNEIKLKRRKT